MEWDPMQFDCILATAFIAFSVGASNLQMASLAYGTLSN
jgi:hypothetical protein